MMPLILLIFNIRKSVLETSRGSYKGFSSQKANKGITNRYKIEDFRTR